MKIPTIGLMFVLFATTLAKAEVYEVLVVASAEAGDNLRIAEFEKDVRQFNGLQHRGYTAAKPYFNVLHLPSGEVYFVFGFRDEVQGIRRRYYTRTIKNLQRLKSNGEPRYPGMRWVPVADIRQLLNGP